jgi:hypothetical protein
MAEPTFAEQSAMQPEPSESDRIRERIQNYKAQLTPNTLQVIQILIESQLKSGLIKPADLDAIVVLRDEVNKAQIDYSTQVQNAQKRLEDLAEVDMAERVAAEEAKMQAFETKLSDERQLRKSTQDKLAQMEAVLASHGISMDLNADGVIGLQDGQVARELTVDEQLEVDNLVSIEKDNIAEAPVEPKEPSRAFQMARALNPDTSVSEQMQDELEPIQNPTAERVAEAKQSFAEWDAQNEKGEFTPSGTTTESFMDEVERVNEVAVADQMELELDDAPTPSAPVVSAGQVNDEQAEELAEENPEFVLSRETIKIVEELPEEPEEEYEEITIPSESELKTMTKSKINQQALDLGFDVPTTMTKSKMIESFNTQTEEFIKSLQDSGEFMSASDSDELDDDDKANIKDGGYF